jgi:predicted dehydrogenase
LNKIRLAVIGTGLAWERLHYPAIKEMGNKYEIAALCNRTKSRAESFAKIINLDSKNVYDDYTEMLKRDDIDAVDILVPIELNYKVSRDVAQAGKHFICEKPMASDMEQAELYLELSRKYGVKIMIAENFRYNEENTIIKDLVKSGKIGDVMYFIRNNISCFPCEVPKDTFASTEWRQHPSFPGGAFLDAALHDIAGIRHIFGGIECVQAFGRKQKEDYNPYVSVNTNILFQSGITGQFTYCPSGMESQYPLVGFRIFGRKGEIYLEEKSCGIINIAYNDGKSEQVKYTPERGYYNELMNFYNAMNGSEDIYVTPEIEYRDVKTVFDILKSISERKVVTVDGQEVYRNENHYISSHNLQYLQ